MRGRICILVGEKVRTGCVQKREERSQNWSSTLIIVFLLIVSLDHLPFVACKSFIFLIICPCSLVKSECGKRWGRSGKCRQVLLLFVYVKFKLEEQKLPSAATCWYLPRSAAILFFPATMSHTRVRTHRAFCFSSL